MSRIVLKKLSNCFSSQENEKDYDYSIWLIIQDHSRNLKRNIRKTWVELHIYFYIKQNKRLHLYSNIRTPTKKM